ncbi:unnamed protein product [Penicillium salamii]|uniref:DUF7779 domain-containing protein n=1 Tax=Penicillium salamii TaxID=1612424 RepID=A0A9W4NLB8_9EURO|nr:unnamed protein product [Penicillium salamii]CAG8102870.1 unnamed protein product [Penicillium salamii]CAG8376308.1 unnamed protein product [Penicillium salamii]CAG8377971.1 unnamed protein product [Penicillium salamii]CAG8379642.1 unnamed protein product [Penicillium salamii]
MVQILASRLVLTMAQSMHSSIRPQRPETPPAPLSTVPFPRDPDFVSRDSLLDQIAEKISAAGSRIALVGIGGVGKSQLSIEYSYRVRSQSPATWVFWIHASNPARFEQSFRDIANQAKISGRNDPTVNIYQLVEGWLRDGKREKWLLILDNADDDGFLRQSSATGQQSLKVGQTNASTKPLLEYLPRNPNGSIMITSRNKEVALRIVDHRDIIKVEPMEKLEAIELLQRKAELPAETPDIQELVEELDFMPLAIIQAASYIVHREPCCTVSQYLEKLRKSEGSARKLLDYDAGDLFRDWEAKNSILVTWQISFDHIRRIRPSATDLLSLMSFFDRQGISEDLLRFHDKAQNDDSNLQQIAIEYNVEDTDSTSESNMDQNFEDDIATLRAFSFISINRDSTVFTMHRLVQLTVRAWLKSKPDGQLERWKEKYITILWQRFPTGKYENWPQCQPLFPHVKLAMSQRPESYEFLSKWATLLYNGAWYAQTIGHIKELRDMASESRNQRSSMFGLDSEQTLESSVMVAEACRLEGQWEQAEQLQVQVMEAYKTKLGADHPHTLTSIGNLASTFSSQGRLEEAEQLEVQVMETCKAKLGVDHPSTLTSIANLACTYKSQGRWKESEQLEIQTMEIRKTKLGVDHRNTLISMGNLASMLRNQGRLEEAEQLQVQVMKARKTKLGFDHPDTLTSMSNLALVFSSQGRWEEAEQLEVQVMKTRKTKLGVDHPDTLTSKGNLALTFWNQGRLEEAEQLQVQVMKARKTKSGVDHPHTLISMGNLALVFSSQGRLEEAEQLKVQVMETCKTKLGVGHPDTLKSIANLASTLWNQGRLEEAEHLEVQVMETCKTKLGADHPYTLTVMANLAHTLKSSTQDKAALILMAECVRLRERSLGPGHPDTLSSESTLTQWREQSDSLSSKVTEASTELKEDNQILASSTTISLRASKPSECRRRTVFSCQDP